MLTPTPHYTALAIRPQIVRDAPLLTFLLSGDSSALRRCVPSPLSPHPAARIILNMWFVPDPEDTTGFGEPGPIGIAYLAAEVGGEEGLTADGDFLDFGWRDLLLEILAAYLP